MSERERSQRRPDRRRRVHLSKQVTHPTVTQPIQPVDGVRPGDHSGHHRRDLPTGVGPHRAGQVHGRVDFLCQADVLGQSHDRHQTGMCHEPVVVERDLHRLGRVR